MFLSLHLLRDGADEEKEQEGWLTTHKPEYLVLQWRFTFALSISNLDASSSQIKPVLIDLPEFPDGKHYSWQITERLGVSDEIIDASLQ